MKLFITLALVGVMAASITALTCLPCNYQERCTCFPLGCQYGVVTDICDCCLVCAKGPGEECGGDWNMFGKCATGLRCVQQQKVDRKGYCSSG